MPVLILRPNGIGSLDNWILSAGTSKWKAIDPGDPINHDDSSSVVRDPILTTPQSQDFTVDASALLDNSIINNVTLWVRWQNQWVLAGGIRGRAVLNDVIGDEAWTYDLEGDNGDENRGLFNTYPNNPANRSGTNVPFPPLLPRPGGGNWTSAELKSSGFRIRLSEKSGGGPPNVSVFRVTSFWAEVNWDSPFSITTDWTNPKTWVDGETPSEETLNTHLRDNIKHLYERLKVLGGD